MPAGKEFGLYRKSDNKLLWRFASQSQAHASFKGAARQTSNDVYQIKELPEGTVCPVDKSPDVYEEVCRIVKDGLEWTIVNPEVDMFLCTGPCKTKKPYTTEHFARNGQNLRRICKVCRNESNKESRDKNDERIKEMVEAGETTFECRGNNVGRGPHKGVPVEKKFSGKQCEDCYKEQRRVQDQHAKEINPSVQERRELLKDEVRQCIRCGHFKKVGEFFVVKTGRADAENYCMKCNNEEAYYKKTRAKRSAESTDSANEPATKSRKVWLSTVIVYAFLC